MSYKTGELYVDESIVLKDSKPNGKYEKLNEEGKVLVSGKYQNGYMVDDWTIYDSKTLELDTVLHYSIHDSIENDKNNKLGFMTGKVNIIVEDMPEFNGESFNEFRNFIASNLKYPEEAADMSIQGTVFVQFAIDLNGKVVDAKITKGVDPLLDNEALRVVNLSPYWRPGMQKGSVRPKTGGPQPPEPPPGKEARNQVVVIRSFALWHGHCIPAPRKSARSKSAPSKSRLRHLCGYFTE